MADQHPTSHEGVGSPPQPRHSDAACSDPLCSYRAEHHRIAELEAELDQDRQMGKLAELETARHNTNLYWAKREKELEAEVEKLTESRNREVVHGLHQRERAEKAEAERDTREMERNMADEAAADFKDERDRLAGALKKLTSIGRLRRDEIQDLARAALEGVIPASYTDEDVERVAEALEKAWPYCALYEGVPLESGALWLAKTALDAYLKGPA